MRIGRITHLVFRKCAKRVGVVMGLIPWSSDHDVVVALAVAIEFEAVLEWVKARKGLENYLDESIGEFFPHNSASCGLAVGDHPSRVIFSGWALQSLDDLHKSIASDSLLPDIFRFVLK